MTMRPGDGREEVVTVSDAAVVRTAPGRAVTGTDISGFIGALPDGTDTRAFTTANASGSTSQAAAVAEAIEAGAQLLLVDEDVSASNFLVRDARMQPLVPAEQEPITVLLDRVRQLHDRLGIASILVMGGSGDYLDVADHVLQLADYQPHDVTARARAVASELPTDRVATVGHLDPPAERVPLAESIDPINEHGHRSVRALTAQRLVLGSAEIDLTDIEQLTELAQTQAVGEALELLSHALDGTATVRQAVAQVMADTARDGLDTLDLDRRGNLAGFRGLELAAALSRLPALRVVPRQS
jgi:predicted ABC-class ATPase